MPITYRFLLLTCASAAAAVITPHAAAQVRLDRADPTIVEQALPRPVSPPADIPKVEVEPRAALAGSVAPMTGMIAAVVVEGAGPGQEGSFAPAYADFLGRDLSLTDLTTLAGRIADVARRDGYPFASASVPPQRVGNGILHVSLDLGKIDAVRVIGARSAAADAVLNHALITGRPARRASLEKALLLVGDLPGVRVTASRFIRQNGFGILLVTIEADRASAYVQLDNRGSREIGPVRSTILGNVRSLLQSGDEFGIVLAQTPIEASEFAFLRGRYSVPVDTAGSMLSVSASYGRSHPGASLRRLDVIGRSTDVAVAYARPLVRRRENSLWINAEFRAVSIEQTLLGRPLRDDRLATLTGTLNGFAKAGPGVLRGEVSATSGLPMSGVTHEGDARTSRADGDARFVMLGYAVDWTVQLARPLTIVVASAGQLASRPLLATAEIGLGGPAFGRGYDYAERTGDEGVMGSLELRADAGRIVPGFINRLQLYTFVDGGRVSNLRDGGGGGQLYSTGGGARVGLGPADGMIEVALPLNADRFDTDSKQPRISLRLSKAF